MILSLKPSVVPYSEIMLTVEFELAILRLTIDRPDVRNAFNDELITLLSDAFSALPKGTRVVLLRGAGEHFCSGGDLHWMKDATTFSQEENEQDALQLAKLYEMISTCPVPVITQIRGSCFGGGCGLVAASDIAIAGTDATFAFSEVRLGLVPATISPFVLPKIGSGHARHLFSTGEAFTAEHAQRIGLVHVVVSPEDLDIAVAQRLKAILNAGPKAVGSAKSLASHPPLALSVAAMLLAETRSSEEAQEGIAAFLQRRRPNFAAKLN